MNYYQITLKLSEDDLELVKDSLTAYNGKKKLIADCIVALIKRQVEIQKGEKKNDAI